MTVQAARSYSVPLIQRAVSPRAPSFSIVVKTLGYVCIMPRSYSREASLVSVGLEVCLGSWGRCRCMKNARHKCSWADCLECQAIRIHFVLSGQIAAFDDVSWMA